MFFPAYIDLTKKKVLVVGGGAIATRRIGVLTDFCTDLRVIARSVSDTVRRLSENGQLHMEIRAFVMDDLKDADIVFAATDDSELNRSICMACREQGIMVNVSSDRTLCDFLFPSVIIDGDVVIGINASGENHSLVRQKRSELERVLGLEQNSKYKDPDA